MNDDPKPLAERAIGGELAPIRSIGLCGWLQLPQAGDIAPMCSWPLTTQEGRIKLHQAMQGEAVAAWDMCDKSPLVIRVTDLAVHYSEFEKEDGEGEMVTGPSVLLIGPDGTFRTGSKSAYDSIRQVALLEGPPPWRPAVMLHFERMPTRNRRMRLAVLYAGRDTE